MRYATPFRRFGVLDSTPSRILQQTKNKLIKMKIAILSALVASAAAFAPAQEARTSTQLSADFSGQLGAQAPVSFISLV